MVRDLRPKKPSAINGSRARSSHRVGEPGIAGELWKTLLVSTLAHLAVFVGLLLLTPYVFPPRLALPPAQMVQLVDLAGGGGGGGTDTKQIRETPQPQPRKPEPAPEPPKAEKPPESKPEEPPPPQPQVPEPPSEPPKAEKPPAPRPEPPSQPPPKASPPEPEMALPNPKVKEPPKKEPPKREEKKPPPAERQLAEKKKELPPLARPTPEPPRQPVPPAKPGTERADRGGGVGPGIGPGSGLALGTGGGTLSLDTANFPFTYYLRQVTNRIEANWLRPQESLGRVIVYFRIKRDGTIVEPQIYESSRNQSVDLLASGAIKRSEPFPPLPIEFGGDYLGIYLCFGIGSACPGHREG
jgi:TonB C terminal